MRIIITLLSFLLPMLSIAQYRTTMVDSEGNLAHPSKSTFIEKNCIASNEVICVRVDTYRSGIFDALNGNINKQSSSYWADAERKVLGKDGNLIYFATTLYSDVTNYHSEDGTWDANCKIYYYVAGTRYAQQGQCSSPKQLHTVSKLQTKSIAQKENIVYSKTGQEITKGSGITAIEFFPYLTGSINGKLIRDIFLNPENSIIVSRKHTSGYEKTWNDDRAWRPTIPQYYRAYPPAQTTTTKSTSSGSSSSSNGNTVTQDGVTVIW